MRPTVGVVVSYAPLEVGWEEAPALRTRVIKRLGQLGLELVPADEPVHSLATGAAAAEKFVAAGVDAIVWVAATWSYDHVATDVLARCPVPIAAWGLPGVETGSLCGSQQLVCTLTEMGHPREFIFGALDEPRATAKLMTFLSAAAVAGRLRRARFGMIGHRVMGMTEVAFHEYDLKEVLGPIVCYLGVDELVARMADADDAAASRLWGEIKGRAGRCAVDDACGMDAMRCALAMKQWAEEESLAGIAVGCYPDMMGRVCLGCGLLAEQGVVTACEGDMNSAVLTYMMHHLSGGPVHNTDLLDVDEADRTMVLSHCGNSAISLAACRDDVALEPVRLMGQGVVSQYPGRPGRVTYANLVGRKGTYRLTYGLAEALEAEMVFPGIPMKLQTPLSIEQFLGRTADFGSGHHWMIAYGDLRHGLECLAKMCGLRTLHLS